MQAPELIACHDCDLLHYYRPLAEGDEAQCRRCGAVLYKQSKQTLERTLALSLTGLILFIIANTLPFLAIHVEGQITHTTLITGVIELYEQDMALLAAIVFITSIFAPGIQVAGTSYVLLALQYNISLPFLAQIFHFIRFLEPWSMMEIFMLGILVSVVKLNTMSEVVPGIAVWSFAILILILAWAAATLDPKEVWDKLGERR